MNEETYVKAMAILEKLRDAINEAGDAIDAYKAKKAKAGPQVPE